MKRFLILMAALWPQVSTAQLSEHGQNALTHVMLHEIGHALIREFDLPMIGPEEMLVDDFATYAAHRFFPQAAEQIVESYAQFRFDDGEDAIPFTEYAPDEWRGYRAICLLYGFDPNRYQGLAKRHGLDGGSAGNCRDFAPEVARGWRRVLADVWMADDARVTEVRLTASDTPLSQAVRNSKAMERADMVLRSVDWHSQINLHIDSCSGGAGWNRNGREIIICEGYIERMMASEP